MPEYKIHDTTIDSTILFQQIRTYLLNKHAVHMRQIKQQLKKTPKSELPQHMQYTKTMMDEKHAGKLPQERLESLALYAHAPQIEKIRAQRNNSLLDKFTMMTLSNYCRYVDFPAYKYISDNKLKSMSYSHYNLNSLGKNLFVGQGMVNQAEFIRFAINVLYQKEIQCMVAIGPHQEEIVVKKGDDEVTIKKLKYFHYFNPAGVCNFAMKCIHTASAEDLSDSFKVYRMKLIDLKYDPTSDSVLEKEMLTIPVYHIPEWLDNTDFQFTDNDLTVIETIIQQCHFAHCSAGVGRAGTFALFEMILKRSDAIFTPLKNSDLNPMQQMDAVVQSIGDLLDELRDIRPGLIVKDAQLQMAIDVSLRLCVRYFAMQLQHDHSANSTTSIRDELQASI